MTKIHYQHLKFTLTPFIYHKFLVINIIYGNFKIHNVSVLWIHPFTNFFYLSPNPLISLPMVNDDTWAHLPLFLFTIIYVSPYPFKILPIYHEYWSVLCNILKNDKLHTINYTHVVEARTVMCNCGNFR